MPAHTAERYVVYSVEKEKENDDKSTSSERSGSICFRDSDYVHLNGTKLLNGNGYSHAISPSPSTCTTDRWGPYWTRRERCCCFWNFLMTVALVVLLTIVILVSKGVVDLHENGRGSNGSVEKFSSADVTLKAYTCPTPKPPLQACTDNKCTQLAVEMLSKMNVTADPCEDFYEYACGGFVRNARVTWSEPRLRVNPDVIIESGFQQVLEELSDFDHTADSVDKRILKSVFQSCTRHTDTPIQKVSDVVQRFGGFDYKQEKPINVQTLTNILANALLDFGVSPLFELDVRKDGRIGIYNKFTDNEIVERVKSGDVLNRYRFFKPSDFIYRDENKDKLLLEYKNFISEFVASAMQINTTIKDDQRFTSMIDDIYHLNVYINRVLYTEETTNFSDGMTKCQNKINVGDLEHRYNYSFSWNQIFVRLQQESVIPYNFSICHTSLSSALEDVLLEFSPASIKHYVIFYVLTQSDIFYFLSNEMPVYSTLESFKSAFEKTMYDTSAMQCAKQLFYYLPISYVIEDNVLHLLGGALRRLFKELFFSLEKILGDLYWVPTKQKKHLLSVLNELTMHLQWSERTSLKQYFTVVSKSYFDNILSMLPFKSRAILRGYKQRIYTQTDSSIFEVTDSILSVPFFVTELPLIQHRDLASLWYGSIGTYLAQPMSELFDVDAWLNFLTNDKIDHSVALTIAHRLQCLVTGYNEFLLHADGDHHYVRGDLTKSANFKDSIALRVAYNSYKKSSHQPRLDLPGLPLSDDQLFYLAYAQEGQLSATRFTDLHANGVGFFHATMCEKVNIKGTYHYYINTEESHHAPGAYRTIGTLSNFKPFADAYRCKVGARMNPKTKCSLF